MARVTIDEEFWTKASRIKDKFNLDDDLIISATIRLWHSSQMDKVSKCSAEGITDHARLWKHDDETVTAYIKGLCWAGLLRECEDGEYEIVGNDGHIQGLTNAANARKEKARRAANKRWGKQDNANSMESDTTSTPSNANSTLSNAKTCYEHKDECSEHSGNAQHYTTLHNTTQQDTTQHDTTSSDVSDMSAIIRFPNDIIQIWNEVMGSNRAWAGITFGHKHISLYEASIGYSPYNTKAGWRDLIERCKKSDFLMSKNWFVLSWLLDYSNISEIAAGKYDNETESTNASDSNRDLSFLNEEGA